MNIDSGWFYKSFIDPLLESGRKKIIAEINLGESVLDIACGTGALVFSGAQKAKYFVGIDLSETMVKSAQKEKTKRNLKNIDFKVADASQLQIFANKEFDVVTLSMALHQFDPDLHSPILNELRRVAKTIIIVDYSVPLPKNFSGFAAKIIEFIAGKEHNQNFKKYYKLGGLNTILSHNQLKSVHSEYFSSGIFQLVKCSAE